MACQLTDDYVWLVAEALKSAEVADLLPDSHPTLDEVRLVLGVVTEEDDVTSRYNTAPRRWSADTPGWDRGTKVGIQATIQDIVLDQGIGTKDAQIVGVGQEFLPLAAIFACDLFIILKYVLLPFPQEWKDLSEKVP